MRRQSLRVQIVRSRRSLHILREREREIMSEFDQLVAEHLSEILVHPAGGNRSLHSLVREGDYEYLEALLRTGGAGGDSIDEVDGKGWTPLHVATSYSDETAVEILLRYGANVHPVHDILLITPMHALAQSGDRISGSAILKAFLSHGDAKDLLFSVNVMGNTPFHLAAQNDDTYMLKELLQVYCMICNSGTCVNAAGPSILNLPDDDGQTPLHVAAVKDNFEAVCMLLDAGASKLACDCKGRTPFFRAAGLLPRYLNLGEIAIGESR